MGIPFLPVQGIIGSDYLKVRPEFQIIEDPYSKAPVVVVPAVRPDLVIFHAFQADSMGNVAIEEATDATIAIKAAQIAIATVEEVVSEGHLLLNRDRRLLSWLHVDVVVEVPGGAHPTACPGYYSMDDIHLRKYLKLAREKNNLKDYLDHYIHEVDGEEGYQKLVALEAQNE